MAAVSTSPTSSTPTRTRWPDEVRGVIRCHRVPSVRRRSRGAPRQSRSSMPALLLLRPREGARASALFASRAAGRPQARPCARRRRLSSASVRRDSPVRSRRLSPSGAARRRRRVRGRIESPWRTLGARVCARSGNRRTAIHVTRRLASVPPTTNPGYPTYAALASRVAMKAPAIPPTMNATSRAARSDVLRRNGHVSPRCLALPTPEHNTTRGQGSPSQPTVNTRNSHPVIDETATVTTSDTTAPSPQTARYPPWPTRRRLVARWPRRRGIGNEGEGMSTRTLHLAHSRVVISGVLTHDEMMDSSRERPASALGRARRLLTIMYTVALGSFVVVGCGSERGWRAAGSGEETRAALAWRRERLLRPRSNTRSL